MDDPPASERAGVRKPSQGDSSHAASAHGHTVASGLNPRSCVTCRRRKVKCDKRQPCSNCVKQHIECVFPAPGRAPRRARKAPDNELLQRLRTLEGVVKHLGATVDDPHKDQRQHGSAGPESTSSSISPSVAHHQLNSPTLDSSFGRLVVTEGRSRYINSSFWANLSNEVEDLRAIMDDESDEEHDEPSPDSFHTDTPSHTGFIFGFSSLAHDLHDLHPPPRLLEQYWKIYEEHCDPLVKMLHLPSMRETIMSVKDNPAAVPRATEALLFAVYFSTITSLTAEECLQLTGEERKELVTRYRFACEQALARAHFMVSEELTVLQAYVMFLICLRRHEDVRVIWALCGIVVRSALTLGLHRDGTNFGLSAYDVEIRRRLWWQICILDIRTSEDHGSEPTIIEHTFDTRFPLNINDDDLSPAMTKPPEPREGITEMSFSLIRFEIASTFRKLNFKPSPLIGPAFTPATLADKEKCIELCHKQIEEKYLRYCDMNLPMHWVICTVSRLIMAKMWLIVYHPHQRLDGGASLPQSTRDRLFITSLESIEYALLLETEVKSVKWGWLFRTYCQWHALAFLLSELCVRTRGVTVRRAWRAVDATVNEWGGKVTGGPRSHLWRPLRKLIAKARNARERELASDKLLQATPLVCYPGSTTGSSFVGFGDSTAATGTSRGGGGGGGSSGAAADEDDSFAAAFLGLAGNDAANNQDPNSNTNDSNDLAVPSTDAMEAAPSPFFANHPPIEPDRWNSSFGTSYCNNGADWLMGDDVGLGTSEFDNAGMTGLQSILQDAGGAAPGESLSASRDNSVNTISGGNDVDLTVDGQKPMVPWEDWDEMVQNFELASGQALTGTGKNIGHLGNGFGTYTGGKPDGNMQSGMLGNLNNGSNVNAGSNGTTNGSSGTSQAWGTTARRPVMGETWF